MFSFIGLVSLVATVMYSVKSAVTSSGPGLVGSLMAQAEQQAGTDPHQAQQLRLAAQRFLSVATQR